MFCGHCGQPNPDTNTVCTSCGKEMKLALSMAPAAAAAPTPQQAAALSNLENYSGPKGVGGWLLFFCIGPTLLTPAVLLTDAANNAGDPLVVAIDLGLSALAISTGIALFAKSRYALPLVRAYFISLLALAGWAVVAAFTSYAAAGAARSPSDASVFRVFQAVRTCIMVGIWWTYFHKSERVLATYGRNL